MPEGGASIAWNRKLGCAWAKMLEKRIDLASTVVEIGPGFSEKVGFGLAELGFRGTVILVEPNDAARVCASRKYRQLLPRAEVLIVRRPFPDSSFLAGRSVDLLVANHVLDDLLLDAAVSPSERSRLFTMMRPGEACSKRFLRHWRELLLVPERLERLTSRIADDFMEYVRALQPTGVVLNDYPSWQHQRHGLDAIHARSLQLMRSLGAALGRNRCELRSVHSSHEESVLWLVSSGSCQN